MCLVFTNIFIKFFAVTANILHPRAVECAYARECQLWVNYYGQLREEHSEKNMCNNVQQCTFVYISEHFSFLNPLILAHRNAHRKTFFHIEKHFCTFLNIFVMCISCTFLYIFAHRKSRFVRKHCGTFFKYRFVRKHCGTFFISSPCWRSWKCSEMF